MEDFSSGAAEEGRFVMRGAAGVQILVQSSCCLKLGEEGWFARRAETFLLGVGGCSGVVERWAGGRRRAGLEI